MPLAAQTLVGPVHLNKELPRVVADTGEPRPNGPNGVDGLGQLPPDGFGKLTPMRRARVLSPTPKAIVSSLCSS